MGGERKKSEIAFDHIHSIVDDHRPLAYSEVQDDERGETCAALFERAIEFFAGHGITIERVMTDNHLELREHRPSRRAHRRDRRNPEVPL